MKWTWESRPPAVTIRPSPAITSVAPPITMLGETPSIRSGLPAFPMPTMRPSRMTDVGLHDAPVVDDERVGYHRVERPIGPRGPGRLAHAITDHLAPSELHLVARQGQIAFDPDQQLGIGESHPIARGRAIEVCVLASAHAQAHGRALPLGQPTECCVLIRALGQAVQPVHSARAAELAPGSRAWRRRARSARRYPAATLSRIPNARCRSKRSARFTSKKWKCEPTWIGPVTRVGDLELHSRRPALATMSPSPSRYSPGIIGRRHRIG